MFGDPDFQYSLAQMRAYCTRKGLPERPIILCGYPKSGNTMTRLVYHNLIGVTNAGLTETITYSRLNRIDPNPGFPTKFVTHGFDEPEAFDFSGFPLMMATHIPWQPFWDDIADSLYIYRHPLDSLISFWYNEVHFAKPPLEEIGLDEFVLKHLPDWIERHVLFSANVRVRLRYEDLLADALSGYETALRALEVRLEPQKLAAAVAMTSFAAVQRMEERHQELHGHRASAAFRARYNLTRWRDGDDVRFARSGQAGQWKTELRLSTIAAATSTLRSKGLGHFMTEEDPQPAIGRGADVLPAGRLTLTVDRSLIEGGTAVKSNLLSDHAAFAEPAMARSEGNVVGR
jgi:hypothetical protein